MIARETGRPLSHPPCVSLAGGLDPGVPGWFSTLEAPGRVLPRPFSLCLAPPGELDFDLGHCRPGNACALSLVEGEQIEVLNILVRWVFPSLTFGARSLSVVGIRGSRRCRISRDKVGGYLRALLGFLSAAAHAVAATLVPNAEVVLEPGLRHRAKSA